MQPKRNIVPSLDLDFHDKPAEQVRFRDPNHQKLSSKSAKAVTQTSSIIGWLVSSLPPTG